MEIETHTDYIHRMKTCVERLLYRIQNGIAENGRLPAAILLGGELIHFLTGCCSMDVSVSADGRVYWKNIQLIKAAGYDNAVAILFGSLEEITLPERIVKDVVIKDLSFPVKEVKDGT